MRLTKDAKRNKDLALEIIEYLQQRDMFHDVRLYLNNKCYSSEKGINTQRIGKTQFGKYYIEDDVDVRGYFRYCNVETVSMSFEGPLYAALNCGDGRVAAEINKIASKYGLYFELGQAWNLAFYKV